MTLAMQVREKELIKLVYKLPSDLLMGLRAIIPEVYNRANEQHGEEKFKWGLEESRSTDEAER